MYASKSPWNLTHYHREVMSLPTEFHRVIDLYRKQGYEVVGNPVPEDLPAFAAEFHVEAVARRGAEGVLIAIKRDRASFESDTNLQHYAEVTNQQPGWRFDFVVLEPVNPNARDFQDAHEFTKDDISQSLTQADELNQNGYGKYAIIAAWSALEAAMRMRIRAHGQDAETVSPPRALLRELYSAGILTPHEFNQAEVASRLRNQIVHGFTVPSTKVGLDANHVVHNLSELTRRLVTESQQPIKQSA
jgi:uncharacterized protein YutE (UPF0331/DUF86 family)